MKTVPPQDRIRIFILEKFPLARKRGITDADPLLESGIMDSMGVLELVTFVEQEFGVNVSDEELVPENFQSIRLLADFVLTKLSRVTAPALPDKLS
jgi:acyl carrier protein